MIFFCDSNGNQLFRTPTEIYQGSNRANVIYFVCPIASTNIVSVAFKLPNGEYLPKKTMQLANDLPIDGKDFENFNVWTYAIPYPVSQYAGTVTVQFFITTVENTIATSSFTFTVQKGIPNIKENEDYDEDDLSNIMFLIANLGNEISDKLGKGETANSSKTIEGFKRVDFESENEDLDKGKFNWLPQTIKDEITAGTARVIFGLDAKELQGSNGRGTMAFVERLGEYNGVADSKIDLLIDGDVYFNDVQNSMVSISAILNTKQDELKSGKNIKTINGQSILGEGDIKIEGGGGGSNITVDTELSTESENPVQNKVITEALDGKVDKIEPPISTNAKNYVYTRKRFGNKDGSLIEDYLYEVSGSATVSTIVSRGAGGTIRIGEPQSVDMAVNLGYMNENVGHKYRFTANMNGFFEDGSILYFDYDTKGEKDIETISTEIIGKTVTLLGNDGSGDDRNLVYGAMRVVTATVSGNALSIPLTNCFVTVRSNYESMTMAMSGTFAFSMEQIY